MARQRVIAAVELTHDGIKRIVMIARDDGEMAEAHLARPSYSRTTRTGTSHQEPRANGIGQDRLGGSSQNGFQPQVLIPMKVVTDSDLIPVSDSDVMPVAIGAQRRWPDHSGRSDRHPSTGMQF